MHGQLIQKLNSLYRMKYNDALTQQAQQQIQYNTIQYALTHNALNYKSYVKQLHT